MLKKSDIQPSPRDAKDLEYYKSLARLSEQRARDIRRIAALEREQLEKYAAEQGIDAASARSPNYLNITIAELEELRTAHAILKSSRAHLLADAYIRFAMGDSALAKALKPFRYLAQMIFPRALGVEAPRDQA